MTDKYYKHFRKDFLLKIQEQSKHIDLVSFLMAMNELSFQEAIELIAIFLNIEPQYVEKSPIKRCHLCCENWKQNEQDSICSFEKIKELITKIEKPTQD